MGPFGKSKKAGPGDGPTPPVTPAPEFVAPEDVAPEDVMDEPETPAGRTSPLRRCIGSGAVATKDRMIRFVIGPGDEVVPDLEECLPGRGLWLTAEVDLVEKAVAKGVFSRAARRRVSVAPDLLPRLIVLLRRRAMDLIGLASRGGGAVAGFEKVQAAMRQGRIGDKSGLGLWLEARDGAEDGLRKLAGPMRALGLEAVTCFDRAELGRALGREEAVHVLIAAGPLVDRLRRDLLRLAGLEGRDVLPSERR